MPVITISRQYGSGGSEIAERVATRLGWALYDNQLVDAIAQRSGMTPGEVVAAEEKGPSLVERISGAFTLGTPEAMPAYVEGDLPATTDDQIVAVTTRIIEEAVQRGPAVFVGRGAQCLLAGRVDALHVFCYAPEAALVRYAIEHLGVVEKDAAKKVQEMNRQREQYVQRHWNRSWRSPSNYHLCIDTSHFGIEGAADLILAAHRRG